MAPDLTLTIRVEGLTRRAARDIADESKERGGMRVTAGGGLMSSPVLLVPSAHDLLTDDADWNAETWAMEAVGLQDLASTFAWLFGRVAGSMSVEATWAGEQTTAVRDVSRDEMLDIVRAGAIGTRTTYKLPRSGSGP